MIYYELNQRIIMCNNNQTQFYIYCKTRNKYVWRPLKSQYEPCAVLRRRSYPFVNPSYKPFTTYNSIVCVIRTHLRKILYALLTPLGDAEPQLLHRSSCTILSHYRQTQWKPFSARSPHIMYRKKQFTQSCVVHLRGFGERCKGYVKCICCECCVNATQ